MDRLAEAALRVASSVPWRWTPPRLGVARRLSLAQMSSSTSPDVHIKKRRCLCLRSIGSLPIVQSKTRMPSPPTRRPLHQRSSLRAGAFSFGAIQTYEAGMNQRVVVIEFNSVAQAVAAHDSSAYLTQGARGWCRAGHPHCGRRLVGAVRRPPQPAANCIRRQAEGSVAQRAVNMIKGCSR